MCRIAGYPDPSRFFSALPRDVKMPEPPPKPTPEELALQAERYKADAGVKQTQINATQKALEAVAADDRERDAARAEAILKAIDLMGKYGMTIDLAAIGALFAPPAMPATSAPEPAQALLPGDAFTQAPPAPPPMPGAGMAPPPMDAGGPMPPMDGGMPPSLPPGGM
jgi:hypothetical protein